MALIQPSAPSTLLRSGKSNLENIKRVLQAQADGIDSQMKYLEDMHKAFKREQSISLKRRETIEELENEIALLKKPVDPKTKVLPYEQRDYHNLNIKYNELRKENELLRKEIAELKLKKRQPLSPSSGPDPANSQNILNMMKTSGRPVANPKKDPLPPISEQPFTIERPTSNKVPLIPPMDTDSSDITPTQLSLPGQETTIEQEDQIMNDESAIHPTRADRLARAYSMDLGANNDRLPSSLPYQDSGVRFSQSTDISSSPTRVKEEEIGTDDELPPVSQEMTEIKDSQYDSEDELQFSIPTPKTESKVHTPANIKLKQHHNLKRSVLQLETPNEITPFKRPRPVKEEISTPTQLPRTQPSQPARTQPTQLSQQSQELLNLSTHPYLKRPWIPEDFRVNPSKNDGLDYAYHVVLRGEARRCIHGTTCQDCDKFYEHMGDLPNNYNGPAWDDSTKNQKKFDIVRTTSRHRDKWKGFEEPAGFGQFDFPTTQEEEKNRKIAELKKLKTAYERLNSCFTDQKYIFKKDEFNVAVDQGRAKVDDEVYLKYLDTVYES